MRTVPAAFQAALDAATLSGAVPLVEISKPSDPSFATVRRALWPGGSGGPDVTFDGKTWLGTRGGFSTVGDNIAGRRAVWELSLTNAQGPDGTALPWTQEDRKAIRGASVTMHVVVVSLLGDPGNRLTISGWYVARPRLDGEWLRLEMTGPREALAFEVPFHPIVSPTCGWQRMGLYRKHPCNSTSGKPTCDGSVAACGERFPKGAPLRIGPSFPYWSKSNRRRRA